MKRDVYQAIADPTRRTIIEMLASQPHNVNGLSERFEMSRTAVSKHIKILKECGLVTTKKEGRDRLCYAELDSLGEVALWVHQYRRFWAQSLDRLENLLKEDNT